MQWSGFTDTPNIRTDQQHQRFYKAETFENALAKLVAGRDPLIAPALQALTQNADTSALNFVLQFESANALVFEAAATTKARKPALFRLIAAKDAEERSVAVRRTWKALKFAHERCPEQVARPLSEAKVFLPDRHRRVEKGREIFCCVTSLSPHSRPLCIARGGRLAEMADAPRLLSAAEEARSILELVRLAACLYDPKDQTGIILPDLSANQIEVVRKGKFVRLLLTLPDGLRTRLTVPRFIHELVTWTAAGAGTTARIRPQELEDFYDALVTGVGPETANDWLARYRRSVMQRKLPEVPPLLPDALAAIGIQ